MKTLGNKLLAGLLVSSPAIADDINIHSTEIVNPTALSQHTMPSASPFSKQVPLKDWELEESAHINAMQSDIDADIVEYAEIREDRHRLLQLSPESLGREVAGYNLHGNESVSFEYGYENDRLYEHLSDDALIDASTAYFQAFVDAGVNKSEFMSHNHFDPVSILSSRGINLVEHFDNTGNTALRDFVASQRLGIDYSAFYDMDSGLKDYQTKETVTVGSILFKGCVCYDPGSPDEVTVIESEIASTPIRLHQLNKYLDEVSALTYQRENINNAIASTNLGGDKGASFMISLGDDKKQDYIYINDTTIEQRIYNASRNRNLSEEARNTLSAIAVNDIVHHEIQHGRAHQEEMMDSHNHHAKTEFSTLFGTGSSSSQKIETLAHVAQAGFKVRLYTEVNSSVYAYLKTVQQYLEHSDASESEKVSIIREAAKQIERNEIFFNGDSKRNTAEVSRLKTVVLENFYTTKDELSSMDKNYVDYLRQNLKDIDISKVPQFFDIEYFKGKNPYQSYQGIESASEIIIENTRAYIELSDEKVRSLSHSITNRLVNSDTYSALTDIPDEIIAGKLAHDEIQSIKRDTLSIIKDAQEKEHYLSAEHQHEHNHQNNAFSAP